MVTLKKHIKEGGWWGERGGGGEEGVVIMQGTDQDLSDAWELGMG